MSEEIKEFAAIEEVPKFDPNKKYAWGSDIEIKISGSEFGLVLNALRGILSTPEAKSIFKAAEAADKIEAVLARNVENGIILEAPEVPEVPKNSL